MTRTTPELAPLLQISAPHYQDDVWPPTYDLTCNRPTYNGGSSVESGFKPGTLRPRSRDLRRGRETPPLTIGKREMDGIRYAILLSELKFRTHSIKGLIVCRSVYLGEYEHDN
ncbi:hypothetical protein AVEN_271760-1 [Araneus ventricosus]|uniref:Uncharacterized protein n=1 Tax=Araneus ventricosus TaxID=182803 RepID=A0A4Y2V2R1_ARAVE|nr:hypothetical protein AVEN_271760-1 [Araneus ventricosus]